MKKDFYLTGNLSDIQIDKLNTANTLNVSSMKRIENIISDTAQMSNVLHKKATLREAQLLPVIMSAINPRIYLGDSPGLGKTIMSLGMYSFYKYRYIKKNLIPKKIIVVTDGNHVFGFQKEWKNFGVSLLPLTKGSAGIVRTLKNNNIEDFDGIILNWDGLKTNGFLEFYLENSDLFDYIILDETSPLNNPKNSLYEIINTIVNKYQGGIKHVVMLNGTPFEKDIFDIYNQMQVLHPKLIPNKKYIEERYVVREMQDFYVRKYVAMSNKSQFNKSTFGKISDYKNQEELKDKLKYFYIGRTKADFSKDLPTHSHFLHMIEMTPKQSKLLLEEGGRTEVLNSPRTSNPKAKFDRTSCPKVDFLINKINSTSNDRPLVYVYNRKSQSDIKELLEKEGYRVAILNGSIDAEEKNKIIDQFNVDKLYDILIFNLEKAMNIPTSDRIIFYDIPLMAHTTQQIKARIDRNNYTDNKFYDFLCYYGSGEMVSMIELGYFREYHSNKFTGKSERVYHDLSEQLSSYFDEHVLNKAQEITDKAQSVSKNNEEESVKIIMELYDLLGIKRDK